MVLLVVFSGCSHKNIKLSSNNVKNKDGSEKVIITSYNVTEQSSFDNHNTRINKQVKYLIQADADYTVKSGYKYFRVIKPFDSSQEMITTPQEVEKVCFSMTIAQVFYNSNPVRCFVRKGSKKYNEIIMYKKKPLNYLVMDAAKIIEYLKLKEKYVAEE